MSYRTIPYHTYSHMEEAWTETEIPTVSYGALGRADEEEGSRAILTEALGENGGFRFLALDRRTHTP